LNFAVVAPGPLLYISVWPTGQPKPLVSTLNDLTGTIVAAAAIVPAGTGGSIDVYATNNTDIIIDINGYYAASFGTPTAGYAFPNASGTPLMTIAPGGNVGIGTPTPASTLDVAGDINMSGRLLYNGTSILAIPTDLNNTAVGLQALSANKGYYNTATGGQALANNEYGGNNTATGGQALHANTSGSNNTATGFQALTSTPQGPTTRLPAQALSNTTPRGATTRPMAKVPFSPTAQGLLTRPLAKVPFPPTPQGTTISP
jgi:hypothetical protein